MSAPALLSPPADAGLIIVDHGSRRQESNAMLLEAVEAYRRHSGWPIVEGAHMELAEPSIAAAMARCVEQGARLVVVFPYFLGPGRHWREDIPHLVAEAARPYAGLGVRHLVTAPLGLHPLVMQVIDERVRGCLQRVQDLGEACDVCRGGDGCTLHAPGSDSIAPR